MPSAPDSLPSAHRRRNSRVSGRTAGFTPSTAALSSDWIFREPWKLRWRPAMGKSHAAYNALVRKYEDDLAPPVTDSDINANGFNRDISLVRKPILKWLHRLPEIRYASASSSRTRFSSWTWHASTFSVP